MHRLREECLVLISRIYSIAILLAPTGSNRSARLMNFSPSTSFKRQKRNMHASNTGVLTPSSVSIYIHNSNAKLSLYILIVFLFSVHDVHVTLACQAIGVLFVVVTAALLLDCTFMCVRDLHNYIVSGKCNIANTYHNVESSGCRGLASSSLCRRYLYH